MVLWIYVRHLASFPVKNLIQSSPWQFSPVNLSLFTVYIWFIKIAPGYNTIHNGGYTESILQHV